jgi:hypothetical protein
MRGMISMPMLTGTVMRGTMPIGGASAGGATLH